MSAGHGSTNNFCEEDSTSILLLGTDNRCKCLVGNKIVEFDHFLPERSTYGEVSLEIGSQWVTVINKQESQLLTEIQKYMDLSSRYPCMMVFVLRCDHVSQMDLDMFTLFQQRFGKKMAENIVVLLVNSDKKESAKPNEVTYGNLNKIVSPCPRKVCSFHKNMKRGDLIKQLMKCWKSVPEMRVNKHERPHMAPFGQNETLQPQEEITQEHIGSKGAGDYPSISGHKRETPWIDGGAQTAIHNKNTMTIVLLGQTGSGKSATGNTILKKRHFESHASSLPVTQECQMAEETICGIKIRVIDTPDFFDESLKNQQKQIKSCKALTQPGPDVYLLVMELGRFTDGEREIVDNLQRVFGEEVVKETIILFTGKEKLRGKTLSEYIKNTNSQLQQLIQTCGSRCLAFNNNDRDDRQVKKLIEMILEMKRKNGNINILEHYPYYNEKKDCIIQ